MSAVPSAVHPVGAPSAHVGPLQAARHSLLLARRRLMALATNPGEVVGMVAFPLIFVFLFVFVFGGAIAGSPHAYLQFALPGILAQLVVLGSTATGIALNEDLNNGIFDRFRSLPIARSAPLVGQILNDVVRYCLGLLITVGVGYLLGFRVQTSLPSALAALGVMFGFALCFSWVSTLIGVAARNPVLVQTFGQALLFPLTFASSVFVPASTLPGWMQAWVHVSPVSLLSETLRGLLLGGPVLRPGLGTLAWALGILVVFAPASLWAYLRRT
jgi:oleandomycin transport system permease protein